jgi:hypothetical protein
MKLYLFWLMWWNIWTAPAPSGCNHNCNQGRACNCERKGGSE